MNVFLVHRKCYVSSVKNHIVTFYMICFFFCFFFFPPNSCFTLKESKVKCKSLHAPLDFKWKKGKCTSVFDLSTSIYSSKMLRYDPLIFQTCFEESNVWDDGVPIDMSWRMGKEMTKQFGNTVLRMWGDEEGYYNWAYAHVFRVCKLLDCKVLENIIIFSIFWS